MKKTPALCTAFILLICSPAFAAFSVSVTPYDGGFGLDFGKAGFASPTQKEVTVRVNSSSGKQYRILQTMMEPLTSARGDAVPPENLVVYSVRGSNTTGTLLTDYETPVTFNRAPIYVSDRQGSPDSFTIVYALKGPCTVPSGNYRGRLRYTLETVDSTAAQVETYLDMSAQIENTPASITISAANGMNVVAVRQTAAGTETGDVVVTVQHGPRNPAEKIIQVFSVPPTATDGAELPFEAVRVTAGDLPEAPVTSERQAILTQIPGKDAEILIRYGLAEGLKAGTYRSTLKYLLEGAQGPQELAAFTFEARVDKVFDMRITTEDGSGKISFRGIKPGAPMRTYEVDIAIKNNTGARFQVSQKVLTGMVNTEGKAIPSANFTVTTGKLGETRGTLKAPAPVPMNADESQVLFVSDTKGSPDSFKVIYGLSAPDTVKAGDYSASMVYSLSEL